MQDKSSQLDRIEQLLREGNALRSQAFALQHLALGYIAWLLLFGLHG